MINTVRIAIATGLLLAAGNAAALGLGQIEVKSRINQPLLAEIPIISTVPGELAALQARLASPETFRRIGLAPPTGLAADLQFSLGSDARGRPVIRVTTAAPVNQAVLNFLVEVDWGQGRLVREYSALVDAPRTASAAVQPTISAPAVAAPSVVQRPASIPEQPRPAPVVATPAPRPPAPALPPPPEPAASSTAVEPLPPPVAAPAAPVAPEATAVQYGPVKRGETLSKIASQLPLPTGYTLDQAMLALLRANPDAFLGQDINQLRRGAVLRVPGSRELGSIGADEAALVVREQMRQWRQARRLVAQPDAQPAAAADASGADVATPAPVAAPAAAPQRSPPARRQAAQARLAIVPPSAPGTATGTRSGTTAGGEGTMLQQQLRQRDEDLAARTAEIGELKDRVAELEKLQAQQQQLLAFKDSELAAAQQRLAETRNADAATGMAAQTPSTAHAAQPEAPAGSTGMAPWLWGSLALLGLALLAWVLSRRSRQASPPPPRRSLDSDALAASMVAARHAGPTETDGTGPLHDRSPAEAGRLATWNAASAESDPPVSTETARMDTPAWHSGRGAKPAAPGPAPRAEPPPSFVGEEDAAALAPQASATQRLKLASAFVDIGDDVSARQMLRELLDDADPVARLEAARMLRELG